MKNRLLLAMLVVWWLGSLAEAACTGSSPSLTAPTWSDVVACHTAAANGDTITVTAGSYTISDSNLVTVTKFVTLIASGTVTLTDNSSNTSVPIAITESTAGNTKVQGFTFVQGTAVHDNPQGVIVMTRAASGKAILITGNSYTNNVNSGDFIIAQTNQGVIWNNTHTGVVSGGNCLGNSGFVRHKVTADTTSWTRASNFGTADTTGTNNLYIENNTIKNVGEGVDVDDNARTVFRYNTSTNYGIESHGTDTSGVYGGRTMEIYNNTFIVDSTPIAGCSNLQANSNGFIAVRGGTALIHDNVIPDPSNGTWGAKSAITFNLENLRRNAGGFPCWNTLTAPGSGYPAPRQAGWGYTSGGTTVTGSSCANCPISQDLEPIYLWNNTGAGNYGSPGLANYNCASGDACPSCSLCPLIATYVQSGREYYTATTKPGYFAYTYPHPLTVGSVGVVGGAPAPPAQTGLLLAR